MQTVCKDEYTLSYLNAIPIQTGLESDLGKISWSVSSITVPAHSQTGYQM